MFREMRRNRQQMSPEETIAVLAGATSGVLAVSGDDGYPYTVPLSYVYSDGKLYFHCAKTGHKIDAITRESKVSFCVIAQDQIIPEKYTTYYRSIIAFGKIRVLEDMEEKRAALEKLAARYSPDQVEGRQQEVEKSLAHVCMLELTIEHLTGKASIELVQ